MRSYRDLSIAQRLSIEFGVVLALALILGAFLLQRLTAMDADWTDFERVTASRNALATEGVKQLSNAVHHFKNYVLRGGEYAQKFEADLTALDGVVSRYRASGPLTADEDSSLAAISAGVESYRKALPQLVALRAQGATIEALDHAVAGADKPISLALDRLLAVAEASTRTMSARFSARLSSSLEIGVGLVVMMLVLGGVIAWSSTQRVVRPLRAAVAVARRVAQGDLSVRVEAGSADETGQLLQALSAMTASLRAAVGQVRAGSDAVGVSSKGIATGNLELSARTSEQAANLEEAASSMQELSATVQLNSQHSAQASELASGAAGVARTGEAVVQDAMTAMAAISKTSKKIAEFIGLIDEVAFQTGILALNASVEAARAGEQGRGFAVVASEVRHLAERTAQAAKEIKGLIAESTGGVQLGVEQVKRAGEQMSQLLSAVERVASLSSQIASASREQSQAIAQVTEAVTRLQGVTQHNASLVERSAARSQALDEQAVRMTAAVAAFTFEQADPSISRAFERAPGGEDASVQQPGAAQHGEEFLQRHS